MNKKMEAAKAAAEVFAQNHPGHPNQKSHSGRGLGGSRRRASIGNPLEADTSFVLKKLPGFLNTKSTGSGLDYIFKDKSAPSLSSVRSMFEGKGYKAFESRGILHLAKNKKRFKVSRSEKTSSETDRESGVPKKLAFSTLSVTF